MVKDLKQIATRIVKVKKLLLSLRKNKVQSGLVRSISSVRNQLLTLKEFVPTVIPNSSIVCSRFDATKCFRDTLATQATSLAQSGDTEITSLIKNYKSAGKLFSGRDSAKKTTLKNEILYLKRMQKQIAQVFEEFVVVSDTCDDR